MVSSSSGADNGALTRDEFLELYRTHLPRLYRFVSRRTGDDRALAEDVVQDTFLRAVRSWREQGLPREPLSWLRTVARNLLVSHFRRAAPVALADGFDPPGEDLRDESPERVAAVQWALARMRPQQARLLEEFHFDGRRVREIARRRGLSEKAVEGRLRRARRTLRRTLQPLFRKQGAIR